MSIKVELGELATKVDEYGFAYLITVNAEARAHLVAVTPEVVGDAVAVGALGRNTLSNVADHPTVTLVWPPREQGGYSLIVDGTAVADTDAASVAVTPTRAVLHRPAPGEDGRRVGNDCQPINITA